VRFSVKISGVNIDADFNNSEVCKLTVRISPVLLGYLGDLEAWTLIFNGAGAGGGGDVLLEVGLLPEDAPVLFCCTASASFGGRVRR
jgi:hypothetical protein